MNLRQFIISFESLLLISAFVACDNSRRHDDEAVEGNVIKEYVNTPKEKARDAKSAVESMQNKAHEQADDIADENENEDEEEESGE